MGKSRVIWLLSKCLHWICIHNLSRFFNDESFCVLWFRKAHIWTALILIEKSITFRSYVFCLFIFYFCFLACKIYLETSWKKCVLQLYLVCKESTRLSAFQLLQTIKFMADNFTSSDRLCHFQTYSLISPKAPVHCINSKGWYYPRRLCHYNTINVTSWNVRTSMHLCQWNLVECLVIFQHHNCLDTYRKMFFVQYLLSVSFSVSILSW